MTGGDAIGSPLKKTPVGESGATAGLSSSVFRGNRGTAGQASSRTRLFQRRLIGDGNLRTPLMGGERRRFADQKNIAGNLIFCENSYDNMRTENV